MPTLKEIHGDGLCHICGQPKAVASEKASTCSYPHGMVPDEQIGDTSMWSWKPFVREPERD